MIQRDANQRHIEEKVNQTILLGEGGLYTNLFKQTE